MNISAAQLADWINSLPEGYYFEDTADELWDAILEWDDSVKRWKATNPFMMVNTGKYLSSGYIEKDGDDQLKLRGKEIVPLLGEWLANQTGSILAFRIPNDKLPDVLAYLGGLGIKPYDGAP